MPNKPEKPFTPGIKPTIVTECETCKKRAKINGSCMKFGAGILGILLGIIQCGIIILILVSIIGGGMYWFDKGHARLASLETFRSQHTNDLHDQNENLQITNEIIEAKIQSEEQRITALENRPQNPFTGQWTNCPVSLFTTNSIIVTTTNGVSAIISTNIVGQ